MIANCQPSHGGKPAARSPAVCPAAKSNSPSSLIRPGSRPLGAAMFSDRAWREIARSLKLSARELQVVRGVFGDRTDSAIAADLGISPHTVHTHFDRIHRKLAVVDRVELILRVMDEFLLLTVAPETTLLSICANRTASRCPLVGRFPAP
jgi:DNA-binding CsgD family transcriptional regulator